MITFYQGARPYCLLGRKGMATDYLNVEFNRPLCNKWCYIPPPMPLFLHGTSIPNITKKITLLHHCHCWKCFYQSTNSFVCIFENKLNWIVSFIINLTFSKLCNIIWCRVHFPHYPICNSPSPSFCPLSQVLQCGHIKLMSKWSLLVVFSLQRRSLQITTYANKFRRDFSIFLNSEHSNKRHDTQEQL